MRIISSYKDCYDFAAHVYGVDTSIVYDRKEIPTSIIKNTDKEIADSAYFYSPLKSYSKLKKFDFEFKHLVFCGRVFLMYFKNNEEKILRVSDYKKYNIWYNDEDRITNPSISKFITNLSIKVNAPVFTLSSPNNSVIYHRPKIDKRIPKLSEIGFCNIMQPLKIYTEIYFFMSNVLRKNPDINPPVEIDNKHKILSAGFDLKTSFRNPIR
jgi:hypothetical protein